MFEIFLCLGLQQLNIPFIFYGLTALKSDGV